MIRSLKAQFCKNVLRKIIRSDNWQMLVAAWGAVMTKSVVKCFRKSKKLSESQKVLIVEDDNLFKELELETENLRSIQLDFISENMDTTSFTDVDAEVLAVEPHLLTLRL